MVRKKGGRNILQDIIDPVRIQQEKISLIGNEDTKAIIKDLEPKLKEKVGQVKRSERIIKDVKSYINSLKPQVVEGDEKKGEKGVKDEKDTIYKELMKKVGGVDDDVEKTLKLYYLLKYTDNENITKNDLDNFDNDIFNNTEIEIKNIQEKLQSITDPFISDDNNELEHYFSKINNAITDSISIYNDITNSKETLKNNVYSIYTKSLSILNKAILIDLLNLDEEEFLKYISTICKIDINDNTTIEELFNKYKDVKDDNIDLLKESIDFCFDESNGVQNQLNKIEKIGNIWKTETNIISYPNFLNVLNKIKTFIITKNSNDNTDENATQSPQPSQPSQQEKSISNDNTDENDTQYPKSTPQPSQQAKPSIFETKPEDNEQKTISIDKLQPFLNKLKSILSHKFKEEKDKVELCDEITKIDPILKDEICGGARGGDPKNFRAPDEYVKKMSKGELERTYYSLKNSSLLYDIDISPTDIMIFIIATFVIRTIALAITGWLIETEMLNTFEDAIFFYIGIYTILFGITVTLVNLGYTPSDLLKDLPNYLYYMFITSNGFFHLLFHIGFLFALGFIPTLLKKYSDDPQMAPPDAEEKRNIYRSVARFSMVSWVILGVLAFAM